jgi:hypothetical protein
MVLPLLFGALAPGLLAGAGVGPVLAGALGAGLGGAIQTGDLEQGLLTGLGAFAGGHLLGPMLGGGAGGATPTAANAAGAEAARLPMRAAMPPPVRPEGLMAGTAAPTGIKGLMGGAMDFAKSPAGMGIGIGSMAGPMLAPMLDFGGKGDKGGKSQYGAKEPSVIPRIPRMPGADYDPGVSGEFDYGISTPYSAQQIMDYTNRGVLPYADGGMLRRMANPNLPMLGPVRLAQGGIVALAEGGDPGQQMPNEREVISAAVDAVKGQHPQPEVALGTFLAMYGEEALRQLVDAVQDGAMDDTAERFAEGENGEVRGPGDGSGTDDMVPAKMDDGSGDVLLSDGEFVLRKDATDSLERMFGGGFLDSVNKAGPKAAEAARQRIAAA